MEMLVKNYNNLCQMLRYYIIFSQKRIAFTAQLQSKSCFLLLYLIFPIHIPGPYNFQAIVFIKIIRII